MVTPMFAARLACLAIFALPALTGRAVLERDDSFLDAMIRIALELSGSAFSK
jgi:hypothetical protein